MSPRRITELEVEREMDYWHSTEEILEQLDCLSKVKVKIDFHMP